MTTYTLTPEQLKTFTQNLIKAGNVVGVKAKDNKFAFGPLKEASEMVLDYDVTLLPPKKYILPQVETLVSFKVKPDVKVEEVCDVMPTTIIGVHPYDLKAVNQLDKLFEENNPDGNYLKRRASTTIIALTPKKASKWSFWASMDSTQVDKGYDILLTDIGGKYVAETGTKRGEELIKKYSKTDKAIDADFQKCKKIKTDSANLCEKERAIDVQTSAIPKLFESSKGSEFWEKQAEKCYSCGSCNLVCPTCYCFDVREELDLGLSEGKRYRVWDGCLLEDFAKVGSGENFREERKQRYMHRFFRKGTYLVEKLGGELACVGCGRCSSVCLPDIADPVKAINTLKEER